MTAYDYRQDFPLLRENKTVYIDNAATAQRPDCVLEAEKHFYETANANPLSVEPCGDRAVRRSKKDRAEIYSCEIFQRDYFYKKYDRKLKSGGIQLRPFKPA